MKQSDDGFPERDSLCVTSGTRIKWGKKMKKKKRNVFITVNKQLEAGKQNPT